MHAATMQSETKKTECMALMTSIMAEVLPFFYIPYLIYEAAKNLIAGSIFIRFKY